MSLCRNELDRLTRKAALNARIAEEIRPHVTAACMPAGLEGLAPLCSRCLSLEPCQRPNMDTVLQTLKDAQLRS